LIKALIYYLFPFVFVVDFSLLPPARKFLQSSASPPLWIGFVCSRTRSYWFVPPLMSGDSATVLVSCGPFFLVSPALELSLPTVCVASLRQPCSLSAGPKGTLFFHFSFLAFFLPPFAFS